MDSRSSFNINATLSDCIGHNNIFSQITTPIYDDDLSYIISGINLDDEIMTDIYDSLTAWLESEVSYEDKQSMDINQFNKFFDKYIYNTLTIHSNQIIQNTIVQKIFDYMCHVNNFKNNKIPFQHFAIFTSDLSKEDFISILNDYNHMNEHNKMNGHKMNGHKMNGNKINKLESIHEYDENEYHKNDEKYENEMDNYEKMNKKQLSLKLRRIKERIREIGKLEKALKNGKKLEKNQLEKIDSKNIYIKKKKEIEKQLEKKTQTEIKEMEFDEEFVYRLYEQKCWKERNKYKQQNEELQNQRKQYIEKYKNLQERNEELMRENDQLRKYKKENILLKQQLNQLKNKQIS